MVISLHSLLLFLRLDNPYLALSLSNLPTAGSDLLLNLLSEICLFILFSLLFSSLYFIWVVSLF